MTKYKSFYPPVCLQGPISKQWCFGYGKEDDYIEVTEWVNGAGFDVDIETSQRQRFQLTWEQYEALKALVNKIENQ
jgi:hypothetical protein